jgi:hypothetical protein
MEFRISLLETPEPRASRIISFARFSSAWCEANFRSTLPKHAGRRSFHVFRFCFGVSMNKSLGPQGPPGKSRRAYPPSRRPRASFSANADSKRR